MSNVTTFQDAGGYAATGKQHAVYLCADIERDEIPVTELVKVTANALLEDFKDATREDMAAELCAFIHMLI